MIDLSEVRAFTVDDTVKGMPGGVSPFSLGEIASQRFNVMREDLPLPLLVLKASALDHNVALLAKYCADNGALFAPHGKTTMAPQIFDKQLNAGAWAITAATAQQVQIYRRFGVRRIVMANQLVGAANLRFIHDEIVTDEGFEFYCFVDSPEGVGILEESRPPRPFKVCIEIGYPGGRGGVRSLSMLDEVCAAIESCKSVELTGVSAFEGLLPVSRFQGRGATDDDLAGFLRFVAESAGHVRAFLPDDYIVTAGGSAAFDKVVEFLSPTDGGRLVLRSGCYVTHDDGLYSQTSPLRDSLRPALELWSYVQSRPEEGLSLLTFGRRDAPFDYGLPVPRRHLGLDGNSNPAPPDWEIIGLNDQHAHLRHQPDSGLQVGDRVVCGISHPCTAFDKWSVISVVDDDYNVIDAVKTFF